MENLCEGPDMFFSATIDAGVLLVNYFVSKSCRYTVCRSSNAIQIKSNQIIYLVKQIQ